MLEQREPLVMKPLIIFRSHIRKQVCEKVGSFLLFAHFPIFRLVASLLACLGMKNREFEKVLFKFELVLILQSQFPHLQR